MNFKNKIVLFTTILSLSGSLHAKPIDELFKDLISVNKGEKISCYEMEMEFGDLTKLCVEQVCGPVENYQTDIHTGNGDKYLHPQAKIQLDGLEQEFNRREKILENYIKLVIQKQKELKKITNPALISDADADKIISDIVLTLKRIKELDQNSVFDEKKFTPVINDRIQFLVKPSSQYAKIYEDYISKIDLKKNIHFAALSGVEVDEKMLYENYVKNAKKLKSIIKKNKLSSNYDFNKELKFLKKNEAYATILNTKLLQEAKSLGVQLQEPICNGDCKKSILALSQNEIYFDANSLRAEAKERFGRRDLIAECRASIYLENINVINSQEIEKEWPKILDRLESNTTLGLSSHSKRLLLKNINEKTKLYFKKDLYKPQLFNIETSDIENAMKDNSFSQMFNMATNKILFQEFMYERSCGGPSSINLLTDGLDELNIHVSPFSCEHPLLGSQILAHELGHVVSSLINNTAGMSQETKNNFVKLRKCSVSEKNSNPNPPSYATDFIYPGDILTSEEDTADLFSYALAIDNKNFKGCAIKPNRNYSTVAEYDDDDEHSSSLVRLMVELQYKNPSRITEACGEVIKRTKSKITKKCF